MQHNDISEDKEIDVAKVGQVSQMEVSADQFIQTMATRRH